MPSSKATRNSKNRPTPVEPRRPPGRPRGEAATHFGRWMDAARHPAQLLADTAGVSVTTINALRRGLVQPSLEVAARLIRFSTTGRCAPCNRPICGLEIGSFVADSAPRRRRSR